MDQEGAVEKPPAGRKFTFGVGHQLEPGHGSNFHEGRTSNNVYFSAFVETAVWRAELATALAAMLDNIARLREQGLDVIEE